ncbi:hypothetical protein [Oscillibacter sp. GMB15532]
MDTLQTCRTNITGRTLNTLQARGSDRTLDTLQTCRTSITDRTLNTL